ncbi:MAG: hypothetical protein NTX04_09800, partial [Verrucomicrobia bacterium]|nr:hypothetical protein [Verrucomicrobiota bacterium]
TRRVPKTNGEKLIIYPMCEIFRTSRKIDFVSLFENSRNPRRASHSLTAIETFSLAQITREELD